MKVWYTIPTEKIISQMKAPRVVEAYLPELCRFDPQSITKAATELAAIDIRHCDAEVLALAAVDPSILDDHGIECIVILGGEPEELKKVIGFSKPFTWMENPLEQEEPSQYVKIRESAFNLLRKQQVKNLSEDELWRAVQYSGNAGLYMAILHREIADGLTWKKLYAKHRDNDRGLGIE